MQANPYPITVALCIGALFLGATETFQLSLPCALSNHTGIYFL